MNYYANVPGATQRGWRASGPVASVDTLLGRLVAGQWQISAAEYTTDPSGNSVPVCTQSVSVTAADSTLQIGAQIPGLTGDASALAGSPDTDPAHYGQYNAPGNQLAGVPVIGGPLLPDLQAAEDVVPAPKSAIEIDARCGVGQAPDQTPCPHGALNIAANNYFEGVAVQNSSNYLAQLQAFRNNVASGSWGGAYWRIDGACPMINPTTAEVLQWAANKWGLNPLLLYAEAVQEGQWDQTSLGDVSDGIGTSSGLLQVADRNTVGQPSHTGLEFSGAAANLARENSCFNVDFYSALLWTLFNGQWSGVKVPPHDVGAAVEAWYEGAWGSGHPGGYSQSVADHLAAADWQPQFFQGQPVAH